jgi:benzoate membrane transport protein
VSLARDLSVSAVTAGFVTVLAGFASSAAIVFQAAGALGVTPAPIGSTFLTLRAGRRG